MASSRPPEVSLVVIAFNERDHGPNSVRAILAQKTAARFELLFVDDGSTDGTAEAVSAAAAGDERFRLIRLAENVGRGAARATGVEAATGQVIGFVDADITLPPDWLARCLAELPGHAAVSGIAVPDGHTAVLGRLTGAEPREVGGSLPISGSNVLFDAEVFARMGFDPRDRIGEDTRIAARLSRQGLKLRRVPGLIVRHHESKTYVRELRWRYANGIDAASLPRLLGVRFADLVWAGWLAAWIAGVALAMIAWPWWLLLGPGASVAAGALHTGSRFHPRPVSRFLVACLADVPLLTAYLIGRTVGIPRLFLGRP
jgi:glycosyltransferase involved in cell wall biosynthesis